MSGAKIQTSLPGITLTILICRGSTIAWPFMLVPRIGENAVCSLGGGVFNKPNQKPNVPALASIRVVNPRALGMLQGEPLSMRGGKLEWPSDPNGKHCRSSAICYSLIRPINTKWTWMPPRWTKNGRLVLMLCSNTASATQNSHSIFFKNYKLFDEKKRSLLWPKSPLTPQPTAAQVN